MDRKTSQLADQGRGFEFAQVDRRGRTVGDAGPPVSFAHLSLLCQVRPDDDAVIEAIGADDAQLRYRIDRMRNWIASDFFPEESRIRLNPTPSSPEDAVLRAAIRALLAEVDWTAEAIQNGLPETAKSLDLPVRDAFRVTYQSLLGTSRGPRVGTLLAAFDREEILAAFD
jgi:lysyl-tRNA synthetase class I